MLSFKNRIGSTTLPFISAWLVAFVTASVFHSAFVLYGLIDIDVNVNVSNALTMIIDDLLGLLPTYGIIIAASLVIAFVFTRFVLLKQAQHKRRTTILYALAGAVAFFAMLSAMQPILNVTLIAGARTMAGICAQCIAGALGGATFGMLKPEYQASL